MQKAFQKPIYKPSRCIKSIRPQNRRTIKPTWQELAHWCCKHPGFSSLSALLFGGLIILSYLLPLQFIPDFNLSETIGILAAAAILGAISLTILGTSLLIPAIILGNFKASRKDKKQQTTTAILTFTLFPIFAISGFFINFIWIIGLAITALTLIIKLSCPDEADIEIRKRNAKTFALLIALAFISFMFASLFFMPAATLTLSENPAWQQWGALAIWHAVVALVNGMLIQKRRCVYKTIMAGIIIIITLFMLTGNFRYMHVVIIEKLRLGNVPNVTITVSESGLPVLHAACSIADAPQTCTRQPDKPSHAYENVTILSRLGNQYYLDLCQPGDQARLCRTGKSLRVVINKKDVLGWSIQEKGKN